MTLYMELEVKMLTEADETAMDPTSDRDTGFMQWQTGPANRSAAKRMMKPWAEALRKGLDRAREETGE